jgi:hypothetical protein
VKSIFTACAIFISAFSACAQQSYFNTPSSEQTSIGKFFIQEQLNFSSSAYTSNLTCVWGLKRNFEIGANLYGITWNPLAKKIIQQHDPNAGALFPSLLLNSQKFFHWNKRWVTTLGGQAGLDLDKTVAWHGQMWYLFSNTRFKNETLTATGGLFLGNHQLFGKGYLLDFGTDGIPVGFQFGFEYKSPIKNLSLIFDRISGTDQLGVSVLGLGYRIQNNYILSLGYQHPNVGSSNSRGIVIEFTRSID